MFLNKIPKHSNELILTIKTNVTEMSQMILKYHYVMCP